MMNLENYAENLGQTNTFIYVLVDLKRQIKEDNVLVKKGKTNRFILPQKLRLFDKQKKCIQSKTEKI